MTDAPLLTDIRDQVAILTLNRPKALNALNGALMEALVAAVERFEADDAVGCLIITGGESVFAAGADIKAMQPLSFLEAFQADLFAAGNRIAQCRKPTIAAVSGYALGGGCELAMMADMIICDETAQFGQPEVNLGIMPGMGGSQRLTRLVGRAVAMDMCLTGLRINASDALRAGLVSRVLPAGKLADESFTIAKRIAQLPRAAVAMIKEAVRRADETSLAEGLLFERRLFLSLFATEDQKEGMAAFIEKRPPEFRNR